MEKKLAQKEKEKKEENLRLLAQKAREERAGIRKDKVGGTCQNYFYSEQLYKIIAYCSVYNFDDLALGF